MFTGIVEVVGVLRSLENGRMVVGVASRESFVSRANHKNPDDYRLATSDSIILGESIATNGVCLTVVEIGEDSLSFDLSEETLEKTSLGDLSSGSRVNLERAMRADGRFGGHIVQGHVDGTGRVVSVQKQEGSTVFTFSYPTHFGKQLIEKGSITVDGISLTVVNLTDTTFETHVIPHTLAETNLGDRQPGERVNLEFDVLAKYVTRLLGN